MLEQIAPKLQTGLIDIARASLWLAVLVVIFVPLERLFAAHPQKILRKGIAVDLGYYLLSRLLPAILLSAPIALLAWFAHHFVPRAVLETTAAQPLWARVLLGMVAGEVGYYWGHRLSHEILFLWQFHSIHHSAEEVDFLVNTRAHPIDLVFGRFCSLGPIYIIGLGSPDGGPAGIQVPVLVALVGTLWGFFIHANLRWRLGPLEWLISTPAFHHWHHTRTGPINRNYSPTLPWLDRIFGTHYLPPRELPSAYGIGATLPDSLLGQLTYPLQPASPPPARADADTPPEAAAEE